jgi:hypothetical protein
MPCPDCPYLANLQGARLIAEADWERPEGMRILTHQANIQAQQRLALSGIALDMIYERDGCDGSEDGDCPCRMDAEDILGLLAPNGYNFETSARQVNQDERQDN